MSVLTACRCQRALLAKGEKLQVAFPCTSWHFFGMEAFFTLNHPQARKIPL
jgi:hypothetical protein